MLQNRWLNRIVLLGLLSGGLSGCQVMQAGLFAAAVPHYHGGEVRTTRVQPVAAPARDAASIREVPRVGVDGEEE